MSPPLLTSLPFNTCSAAELARYFSLEFSPLKMTTFKSGEIFLEAPESLTARKVILFHNIFSPVNQMVTHLVFAMSAIRQRQVDQLTLVIPYLPYSRQDRPSRNGGFLGIEVIANLLGMEKPDALFVLDLHSQRGISSFPMPLIQGECTSLFASDISNRFNRSTLCLISPDEGGIHRTQKIAEELNVPFFSLNKQRIESHPLVVQKHHENLRDKVCLFIDDIIDTGETLLKAGMACEEAKEKHIYATHGVFSDPKIGDSLSHHFDSITVTNSIFPHFTNTQIRILPCWEMLNPILQ